MVYSDANIAYKKVFIVHNCTGLNKLMEKKYKFRIIKKNLMDEL